MARNASIEQYLSETVIPLRLSCIAPSGWPVVLSLWFLFEDGELFCATPEQARVVTYLTEEPRCAFEVASDEPPYCGVRGRAVATIEPNLGPEMLERLLYRYVGSTNNALARELLARSEQEVAIRLTPRKFHTWDFTERMASSFPNASPKLCPDPRVGSDN